MGGLSVTKKITAAIAACIAVMFGLPFLAVQFAPAQAAMAVCILLFYAVNPTFVIGVGIYAGRDVRNMWGVPFAASLMFLLSAWSLFDMREMVFAVYAGIYLLFGVLAMGATAFFLGRYSAKKERTK